MKNARPVILHFAFCLLPFTLTACGTYQLKGRVIEGGTPAMVVVSANDKRLEGFGLPGAVVDAVVDPDRPLQQIRLQPQVTDAQGYFAIPVEATGAGLLEYNVQVTARLAGHTSVRRTFKLPGAGKRVLVIVAPGESDLPPDEPDILDETRRMGEQLSR